MTSSSVNGNDQSKYGPQLIIDGKYYESAFRFFQSKKEDYPWVQWRLPWAVNVSGITIAIPGLLCPNCAESFQMVEVRAGKMALDPDYQGRIGINKKCGTFKGPGKSKGQYKISCDDDATILADFVTIQILDDNIVLGIDEIKIETGMQGKVMFTLYNWNIHLSVL